MAHDLAYREENLSAADVRARWQSRGLSIRTANTLAENRIKSWQQLAEIGDQDLLRIPNFGRIALREVKACLASRGADTTDG